MFASAALLVAASTAAAQPPAPATVSVKAPDGITLKATYYSAGKPGPAVMLLHMCNSDRRAWAPFATAAAARGYHVLALDFREFGESGGEQPQDPQQAQQVVNQVWPRDVDAALAWLAGQPGVDKQRIAASGGSCGVNQAVQLARRHPEVKTVMLLSGPVAPEGRDYLRRNAWVPVMAAASHDDGGAVDTMRWLLGWSRNPNNKFLEYQKAGHGTEMFAVEKGLQPAMLDWLDAHLRNAPLTPPAAAASYLAPAPTETFWDTLMQPGGAAKAREMYDARKRGTLTLPLWPEQEMNAHGYQLLQGGNAVDAIIVLQMNADAYPTSANVYDSLSDAYLEAGNKVEALRYAEKAIATLAIDTNTPQAFKDLVRESAERKIRELKK